MAIKSNSEADGLIEKWLEIKRTSVPPIDPTQSAVLVVDMQEYQVRKDWPVYKTANAAVPEILDYFMQQVAEVVEPNIQRLLDASRKNNMRIVYTMFSSHTQDGADFTRRIKMINERSVQTVGDAFFPYKEDPASEIIASMKPEEGDLVIVKPTSNVFTATGLDFLLRNMGIERLLVVGVVTNACVEGAARGGTELGYDVTIIEDACAAWSPEIHRRTLESFEMYFGSVISTEEAIGMISEN